ncbi:MAG: hypothetical protein H6810_03280 [Phycisphaeraceae bacterium]|nr:MAG: hypothetical protein H6810_03280 [Phycisphaeraceae bacterium]
MSKPRSRVPVCAPPPEPGALPRTLTFALTADERAAVLRVLRRYSSDRAEALRMALGIARAVTAERAR